MTAQSIHPRCDLPSSHSKWFKKDTQSNQDDCETPTFDKPIERGAFLLSVPKFIRNESEIVGSCDGYFECKLVGLRNVLDSSRRGKEKMGEQEG